jgi:hypothetical protein
MRPSSLIPLLAFGALWVAAGCPRKPDSPSIEGLGASCSSVADCAPGTLCIQNINFAHQDAGASCEFVCRLNAKPSDCPNDLHCVPVVSHGPRVRDGEGICEKQTD